MLTSNEFIIVSSSRTLSRCALANLRFRISYMTRQRFSVVGTESANSGLSIEILEIEAGDDFALHAFVEIGQITDHSGFSPPVRSL